MATRTSLAAKPLHHGRYQLTSRVRQQGEHGYERANGIPVRLERRVDGRWQRVRDLALTTVHGRAVVIVDSPGRYRAVVHADGNHGGSTSKPVSVGG